MDPEVREGLARSWKALMAVGIIAILIGCVAILVPAVASVATAIFIGWILLIAGAFLVAAAFTAHSVGTVILRLLWAFLTVIVGIYLIVEPHGGTLTLTLVLGIYFLFMGVTRVDRRLPGPRPAGRRPRRPQRLRRPPGRHPHPRQAPRVLRLGDRPPRRNRPDLRGLDARPRRR